MVKKITIMPRVNGRIVRPAANRTKQQRALVRATPRFAAVTQVSTAPVAIGNSIRGHKAIPTPVKDGMRVVGRDFAFAVKASVAAANDWTLVGGIPVTPACMNTSVLRAYSQTYAKFKINGVSAHYITSSPTSQAGDIMFYYERDRNGPSPDTTSSGFLPFVMSDPNTILGPQWLNHSLAVVPTKMVKTTDYGLGSDLNADACGTIFIYSKTNAASSPGYVIVDYDITFTELSLNPRAGIIPLARAKWNFACLGRTGFATVSGTTLVDLFIQGLDISGTTSALPAGTTDGDIFKVILDVTNSTVAGVNAAWVGFTAANLLAYDVAGTAAISTTIDDGFTCYGATVQTSTTMRLYPTLSNALNDTSPFFYGFTGAASTVNVCVALSYVGTKTSNMQSSY